MRCATCHGKGKYWITVVKDFIQCTDCNGSGIVSCCEGNPNMNNDKAWEDHDRQMEEWLKMRDELFRNPDPVKALEFWNKSSPDTPPSNPNVPLAAVHKARLQWLDATDRMIAESTAWLTAHNFKTEYKGAPPLTPKQRDADRKTLGKPPIGK